MLRERYFKWLCGFVCDNRFSKEISYDKLLRHLHNIEFTYTIARDSNRFEDGVDLRYRFALANDYDDEYVVDELRGPCSVLEMLIALSIRCEENIMDDPAIGDRTGQWFWGMIVNLKLGSMTDNRFDIDYVDEVIDIFLNREYEPNGEGGLFTIKNCDYDLRNVEIWYQLCYYLDTIT